MVTSKFPNSVAAYNERFGDGDTIEMALQFPEIVNMGVYILRKIIIVGWIQGIEYQNIMDQYQRKN